MSQMHPKSDGESPPSTPRWVKVLGLIALAVILLFVVLMLIDGDEHGPDRHTPSIEYTRQQL